MMIIRADIARAELAPSWVVELPVWQDADQWARSHQLPDWQKYGGTGGQQFLISRLSPSVWQQVQRLCHGDIRCWEDSCQQVRREVPGVESFTREGAEGWLVSQPPPLESALMGVRWACDEQSSLRWQGQSVAQPHCWAVERGIGCDVWLTELALLQPYVSRALLVFVPDQQRDLPAVIVLAQQLGLELRRQYDLPMLSGRLWHLVAATETHFQQAYQQIKERYPDVLIQPDYPLFSPLLPAPSHQLFMPVTKAESPVSVPVALIDTGVDPSLVRQLVNKQDMTGMGYQAGVTGSVQATTLSAYLPDLKLSSYQACLPVMGRPLWASCSSLALVRALDGALTGGNQVIQLGPQGQMGDIVQHALQQVVARQVVIVTGAGDSGPDMPVLALARSSQVLAVTAMKSAGQRPAHAGQGQHVVVAAPGGSPPSDMAAYNGFWVVGTSLAAARVAALIAHVQAVIPQSLPQLQRLLRESSDKPLGVAGQEAGALNTCRFWRLLGQRCPEESR
ncbi:MAG: S8 family serine peptidase [Marinobacterium sp.]|nr:S8 family serine peptidase [Marinobacterium sp.]